MKPNIVGFIFARGGSKGVLRKNLRLCAGKPLLAHAITAARQAEGVRRVVVSTEDPEIAEVARTWGAEVPFMRPAELARDDAPEWLAWRHAIRALEEVGGQRLDVFLSVPATAPLRKAEDIDECLRALQTHDADVAITVTPARRHPSFNMVTVENGLARLMMPSGQAVVRRQQVSPAYDVKTVAYAARPVPCRTFGRSRFVSGRHNLCHIIAGRMEPAGPAAPLPVVEDYSRVLARILSARLGAKGLARLERYVAVSTIPVLIAATGFYERLVADACTAIPGL